MTLDEAKRRIEELERRVRELEARPPIQYHYHTHGQPYVGPALQPYVQPLLPAPFPGPGSPPWIVCGPGVAAGGVGVTCAVPQFTLPMLTSGASH